MLRVCGATEERKSLDQHVCWCRGLFCGRGGGRLSLEFRRDFRTSKMAGSLVQFEELICQMDLFDGDDKRTKWRARLRPLRAERPKRRSAATAEAAGAP